MPANQANQANQVNQVNQASKTALLVAAGAGAFMGFVVNRTPPLSVTYQVDLQGGVWSLAVACFFGKEVESSRKLQLCFAFIAGRTAALCCGFLGAAILH